MLRCLLLAVVFLPSIFAINSRPCEGYLHFPSSLVIHGCETSPCHTTNGATETFTVSFESGVNGLSLHNTMYSLAFGVESPIELAPPYDNVCTSGATCPVAEGENLSITILVDIVTQAQGGVLMPVRYFARNPEGEVATCIEVNLIID